MGAFFAALVSPITAVINKYQQRKQTRVEAEAEVDRILTEASAADAAIAGKIALVRTKNENNTWKDEYALLIITMPYLVSFVIALAAAFGLIDVDAGTVIKAMFAPLAEVPEYWQNTFQVGILSALGVTIWNKATK